MEPAKYVSVAYGWNRLLREVVAAALSSRGWRVTGSQAKSLESTEVGLVLAYSDRPTAIVIEEVRRARTECPTAKIVLVGGAITDAELVQFIEAGMGAYVATHQGLLELLEVMQMVQENRNTSPGRIIQLVLDNISRLSGHRDIRGDAKLTLREQQVLYLITTGIGNKEIASCLSISPNTVKNHVHNLLQKLNVSSRHDAAKMEARSCDRTDDLSLVRKATQT
jgi:DNA-binding NarL/FixJ family response regulator